MDTAGRLFLGVIAAFVGCDTGGLPLRQYVDADREASMESGTSDEPADDSDASTAGPLTFVVSEAAVTEDRICDLDGDGLVDNVVADLGRPASSLLSMTISAGLQSAVARGHRVIIHIPWVEDRDRPADPEVLLVVLGGEDTDAPVDMTDDFSGEEPFFRRAHDIDGCGEPLYVIHASIADGELRAEAEVEIRVNFDLLGVRAATVTGTIERHVLEAHLCSFATVADLGQAQGIEEGGDLSMLEQFLMGGEAFGMDAIPGVTPDLDFDGDGLERFVTDEQGNLISCIDGDSTAISGRDCWQDRRIADAFSLILRLSGPSAQLAGPEPAWREDCHDPPETSVWDPR
jgi:hypothetical protein